MKNKHRRHRNPRTKKETGKSFFSRTSDTSLVTKKEDDTFFQTKLDLQKQEEEEEVQAKRIRKQVEEEEEVQAKLIRAQEEEEEPLQARFIQKQEPEEEEVQMKRIQKQEEEEEVQSKSIQRQIPEEEEVQAKLIQAQEEEEEVQAKFFQKQAEEEKSPGSDNSSTSLEKLLDETKGKGDPLPEEVRNEFEAEFNSDFAKVRVFTCSKAIKMTRMMNAHAFTHGHNIYFNKGRYDPHTDKGKSLLAHELTHVVQQTGNGK